MWLIGSSKALNDEASERTETKEVPRVPFQEFQQWGLRESEDSAF